MFGYTVPIESVLSEEDRITYRNYYCETCHHLREEYGFMPTLTVNYEMTFAALFFNSILDEGEKIHYIPKKHFCLIRKSASHTELMHMLTAYSVLVANNSLLDDKMDDSNSLKANLGLLGLNRAITKAKNEFPEYNDAILKGYEKLREIEASGECDPIVMGGYSAQSMIDVLEMMIGDRFDRRMHELFRNLGIWVYVMDAIEDFDEDLEEGTYNPFVKGHPEFKDKKAFVKENIFLIGETMGKIIGNIQSAYSALRNDIRFNGDILDNIIYQGIPFSAHRIIRGDKTMSLSLKNMITGRMNRGMAPSMM